MSMDRGLLRQYYIAVDRIDFKMQTLVELLAVLGRKDGVPITICCSSRDGLDAVADAVGRSGQFLLSMLHSDSAEDERATNLETFRLALSEWAYFKLKRSSLEQPEAELRPGKSQVLVMTDICLPSPSLGEAPLPGRVMINFDIPAKKEAYSRRLAACLGSSVISPSGVSSASSTRSPVGSPFKSGAKTVPSVGGKVGSPFKSGAKTVPSVGGKIAITMVVGGEVLALSTLEESCGIIIDEMPIDISELV